MLAASAAAVAAAGCGGHQPRPAALRVERANLVLLAHTLQQLQAPIHSEVAAAHTIWPAFAGGLPASLSPATRLAVLAAERRAAALALPEYVTSESGGLTGPAGMIGGLLKAYAVLTRRGWQFLASVAPAEAPPGYRLLRANAGLYIYSLYDGHYDLSSIGKALQSAYRKLGGAPAFGRSLTQAQVAALAQAYSIPSSRLLPHPPPSMAV